MSWMNGNFFSSKEDAQTAQFLKGVGLDENQQKVVSLWHKSQLSGQLNLWVGVSVLFGAVLGLFLGSFL